MHMPMNWGHNPHRHYSAAGMEMDVPLVPAPTVFLGLIAGMLIGMMVGYKKATMVQAHRRMLGGMGHGMRGGMRGYGGDGDWMTRKRAMMQAMAGHHHHGYGASPCCCGAETESAGARQPAEDEERPDE